jgi:hypothetical protein
VTPFFVKSFIFTKHHAKPNTCAPIALVTELMKSDHFGFPRTLRVRRDVDSEHAHGGKSG